LLCSTSSRCVTSLSAAFCILGLYSLSFGYKLP
jgi:hypothetical protein